MNRRGFLKFAASAPVAARVAGPQIAEMAVSSAGSLRGIGIGAATLGNYGVAGVSEKVSEEASVQTVISWIAKNGLPEWFLRDAWEEAAHIHAFDADLAANRSMSLSAKLNLQRRRNYDRILKKKDLKSQTERDEARNDWRKKFGWWF